MLASQSKKVTVIWVIEDDHKFRGTLKQLFDNWSTMQCPLDFGSCVEALELIDAYSNRPTPFSKPDVIILDVNLPEINGLEGIGLIKQRLPETQIVMLTIRDDTDSIYRAFQEGASGYLIKGSGMDEIINAIQQASLGGMLMPAPVAAKVKTYFKQDLPNTQEFGLSLREKEVLEEMASGYTQKEMADRLDVSPNTINTHVQNIYSKLHVRCAPEAVAKAIRNKVIL